MQNIHNKKEFLYNPNLTLTLTHYVFNWQKGWPSKEKGRKRHTQTP